VKFLVDEMLQRLGSWLRAAGYDTVIARDGRDDYALLRQAIAEDRLLVTRDRELARHRRAPGRVILLECENLDDCIRELGARIEIDWLHHPFQRCLICNTELVPADDAARARIPERARARLDEARYCPTCRKVYWEGSHVNRMRQRLETWQGREESSEKVSDSSDPQNHRVMRSKRRDSGLQ